jgi:hypothetical protein
LSVAASGKVHVEEQSGTYTYLNGRVMRRKEKEEKF